MASTTTRIKPIRIKNETADYFEKRPLNRIVESLAENMQNGKVRFDGENLIFKGSDNTDLSDISEMASLMRVPTETLLADFKKLLEDGTLYYSGNKLVNPHYEEFERLCEVKKQPIDKVIGNIIRQMGG